jgi:hypothetical protein
MGRWIGLIFLLLVSLTLSSGTRSRAGQGCLSCHQGIEAPGKGHRFPCERCHSGDPQASEKAQAHRGMAANPSALEQAPLRCGPCHADQVKRVQRSLMATSAGEINPTRILWGAQPSGHLTYLNHPIDQFPGLPLPDQSGQLVDDLLRRRCLRCHLHTPGSPRHGEWRAAGCAACHMPYAADGLSHTGDRAVAALQDELRAGKRPQKRGYPLRHRLTRAIPTSQCLTCHNGHRVGMDYVGLAERDYEESYRFNAPDGESPSLIYGLDPRGMTPDIHHERGLACIDCHNGREVMGHGTVARHSGEQVTIRCQDCHGTPARGPRTNKISVVDSRGNILSHVRRDAGQTILTSKSTGRRHVVPALNGPSIPLDHRVPEHIQKMECHSCHALWSYQDFGFHLLREDRADYQKWAPLWMQNDPQVQELLRLNLPRPPGLWAPPRARDYLDGTSRPGVWFSGFSYRRLENPIFGINGRGKTSVFRPLHQFVVSQVDERGQVLLDSRIMKTLDGKPGLGFNPYTPHSIRRPVRSCEGCHLNPRAIGLGNRFAPAKNGKGKQWSAPLTFPRRDGVPIDFEWEALVDPDGKPLQTQTRTGARPYQRRELETLLGKSRGYKGWVTRHYQEKGLY